MSDVDATTAAEARWRNYQHLIWTQQQIQLQIQQQNQQNRPHSHHQQQMQSNELTKSFSNIFIINRFSYMALLKIPILRNCNNIHAICVEI